MRTRGSVNSEKFTPHARSDTSSEEGDRRKRTGSAGVELPNLADSRNQGILKDLGKGGPGHLLFPRELPSPRTSRKVCTGKFVPAPEAKRRSASLQSQAKKMVMQRERAHTETFYSLSLANAKAIVPLMRSCGSTIAQLAMRRISNGREANLLIHAHAESKHDRITTFARSWVWESPSKVREK